MLLLLLVLSLSFSLQGQEQLKMAVPAPKGIVVFAGMALANGHTVDSYTIDRSYDQRQWEQLAELRSPQGWEAFRAAVDNWTPFRFQGAENSRPEKKVATVRDDRVIDSMGYWLRPPPSACAASPTTTRLPRKSTVWYRVRTIWRDAR